MGGFGPNEEVKREAFRKVTSETMGLSDTAGQTCVRCVDGTRRAAAD